MAMIPSVAAPAGAARRARQARPGRVSTRRGNRETLPPSERGAGTAEGHAPMSVRQGPWTVADVPDQGGRTAVVTGANSGIGFEAATVLARRGGPAPGRARAD